MHYRRTETSKRWSQVGTHVTTRAGRLTPSSPPRLLAGPFADQVVHEDLGEDVGANLCSPYYESYHELDAHRRTRVLLPLTERGEHSLATVRGGNPRADFEIPEGLDPLLTLAPGLRTGYSTKPPLPFSVARLMSQPSACRTASSTTHCPVGRTAPVWNFTA